jgi:hypothetical protein
VGTLFGYPTWRLVSLLSLPAAAAWAVSLTAVTMALLPLFYVFALRPRAPEVWRRAVAWVAYVGLGSMVALFDVVVLRDLLWTGLTWVDPDLLEGRERLSALVCLGAAASLSVFAYAAARHPCVRQVRVPIPGLSASLEGLRIAQISDLHVGPTIRRAFVESVVDAVEAEHPDLIVFTGDLADGDPDELAEHVQPLARLRAPLGFWFVTGNHEYYADPAAWMERIPQLGMEAVLNRHVVVERAGARVVIGGLPDPAGSEALPNRAEHAADPDAVFAGAPDGLRLLLVHQPRAAVAAAATEAALALCGHTHGGQLFPWGGLVRLQQPLLSGLHRAAWGGWIYVSRGTGYWGPPMRLGVSSEITILILARA